jgi:hypothetical protein
MKKYFTVVIMAVLLVSVVIWGRPQAQALPTQNVAQKLSPAEQGIFLANYANMQLKVEEASFVESGTEVVLSYRLTNLANEPVKQVEMLMLRANAGANTFLAWQQKVKLAPGESKSLVLTLPAADGFIPLPKELATFAKSGAFALAVTAMSAEQVTLKADQGTIVDLLVKTVAGENSLLAGYSAIPVEPTSGEGSDLCTSQALIARAVCSAEGVAQFFCDGKNQKSVIVCNK